MADAPAWARALVTLVCAEAGVEPPHLSWRRSAARPTSSGITRAQARRISVVAGSDSVDQRLTVLHELAHWLLAPAARPGRRLSRHHDRAFYRVAFELYRCYGVPQAAALSGESARYPSALAHARALGLPGAEAAWRQRRMELRLSAERRPPMRVLVPEHRVRLVRDGRWTRCSVCGVRVVGRVLARLRRRPGRHILLGTAPGT